MKKIIAAALLLLPALASAEDLGDKARVTIGVPTYVYHPDDRSGGRSWNQGWFNNEGVLVDVTWPVYKLGDRTNLRVGPTAGGFDNSEFKTSYFFGGAAEIETFATDKLAFSVGTYAGAITGYEDGTTAAAAPYVGTSYAVDKNIEIGVRGYWLPGHTVGVADSDAYIGAFTVGTRF